MPLFLLAILAMGAVSASDVNSTQEEI